MVYYTMDIFTRSREHTTIMTEFVKIRYNRDPMGQYVSNHIFQAKVYEIIGDIGKIKTFINDIFLHFKGSFYLHIDQIRVTFDSLREAGLKVNTPECSVGLKNIIYL